MAIKVIVNTASDYLCWDLHTVLTAMKKCMDMSKDQTVCQMFITSHFETSGFHSQYCIAACIWWLCAFVM
jgi:hypothetical protein